MQGVLFAISEKFPFHNSITSEFIYVGRSSC
jgi:hypothetical protein